MATITRFMIECQGGKHEVKIDTVMIPDPDNPKSGKQIPAPRLNFLGHCSCPDPDKCCGDAHECTGQEWLESEMALIRMTEACEPSCAQWALEFSGAAPKRVNREWWSAKEAEKAVSGRK